MYGHETNLFQSIFQKFIEDIIKNFSIKKIPPTNGNLLRSSFTRRINTFNLLNISTKL